MARRVIRGVLTVSRPRALVLTARLPWPLDDGGRIVMWQSLWSAARSHDVTLLSFVPPGTERDPLPKPLRDVTSRVVRVPHGPPGPVRAALIGLFGRWPYMLARYRDASFARAVREVVQVDAPRFAFVNNLHMAPYADALGSVPMVLREQNVEYRWMDRFARTRGMSPAGLYARAQVARLRRVERVLCERSALVLAIQDEEAEALRALAPRARVRTVPVGIDLSKALPPSPVSPPVVLLPGSFEWPPNTEGALRFLAAWPRVQECVPHAKLRLAGKAPPAELRAAAGRAGAEIAADVPSMYEEFARATVVVVPLWLGAGARVKIVEALAACVPVAATAVAAEGLGLTHGEEILVSGDEWDLAAAVATLLLDSPLRTVLTRAGRSKAESRWSIEIAATLQEKHVAEALAWEPRR